MTILSILIVHLPLEASGVSSIDLTHNFRAYLWPKSYFPPQQELALAALSILSGGDSRKDSFKGSKD